MDGRRRLRISFSNPNQMDGWTPSSWLQLLVFLHLKMCKSRIVIHCNSSRTGLNCCSLFVENHSQVLFSENCPPGSNVVGEEYLGEAEAELLRGGFGRRRADTRVVELLEKLMDATREELPDTMAVVRLYGMEISALTMELSDNGSG
ncbi:hypothetical protein SASPL_145269 [Salvia splendens]|uniref:Uncharacterized protein n=1 Tax=Salvia splendens TaxID=180675 RepID=A0A8X8Z876_SALSN|nr:hypothetical protein SASPL_145269 [Salvia splendens]